MATRPNARVRPCAMDRPVLYSLVERLRAEERLTEFAAALPTRARVSEPVLPLLLAALHSELNSGEVERGLIVVLPEDADVRAAAAPRRRARPSARCARARRPRLRVSRRGRGGDAAGVRAARRAARRPRRRARPRVARRASRLRRLRARRARRGARAIRRARRPRRRLPDHRTRAAPHRALR